MERVPEFDTATNGEGSNAQDEARTRIILAAIELLSDAGRDAVTTRAVAEAAGVQAPTIYRLFRDKDGLLNAVAEHGFRNYLKEKEVRDMGTDPVENLRAGWDLHVGFGLSNPALYLLMYANPRPAVESPAAEISHRILRTHIHHIAIAGQLLVNEEQAVSLVHACACGTVLTLLAMREDQRDMRVSEMARDATLASITTTSSAVVDAPSYAGAAITLRAVLTEEAPLSKGERYLLVELLERLASH